MAALGHPGCLFHRLCRRRSVAGHGGEDVGSVRDSVGCRCSLGADGLPLGIAVIRSAVVVVMIALLFPRCRSAMTRGVLSAGGCGIGGGVAG